MNTPTKDESVGRHLGTRFNLEFNCYGRRHTAFLSPCVRASERLVLSMSLVCGCVKSMEIGCVKSMEIGCVKTGNRVREKSGDKVRENSRENCVKFA